MDLAILITGYFTRVISFSFLETIFLSTQLYCTLQFTVEDGKNTDRKGSNEMATLNNPNFGFTAFITLKATNSLGGLRT